MGRIKKDLWINKYSIAKEYFNEFGNLLVPDKYIYKGINLGNWIYLQRKNYRDGKLNKELIILLEEIHMVWDARPDYDKDWEEKYLVAEKFFSENGSLLVPVNQIYEGVYLGKWVSHG